MMTKTKEVKPSLAYDATPEQRNLYHRLYRLRNLEKRRAYGRKKQAEYRERDRKLRAKKG
jgi:hypothetical protein